jgi:uncharacterized protein YkwD
MTRHSIRTAVPLAAALAAIVLSGCGGSGGDKGKAGPPGAATPVPPTTVDVGHALVITNSHQPAPKTGALNRLKEGLPAPGAPGKAGGPESLISGAPDISILGQLPQPRGLAHGRRFCSAASAFPSARNTRRLARAVLCLLNIQRTSRGLRPLRLNGRLTRAAVGHSRDMVARRYFAHVGADGSPVSRIRRAGYIPRVGLWTIGENLAWGTGTAASPAQIMDAWMNSPEHKANILTPGFREIGVGVIYTTTFGAIRLH